MSVSREESSRFETGIGPMTDRFLGSIVDRLTSGDFREKVMGKIVDPTFDLIYRKAKPYIFLTVAMYIILIILLGFIIFLLFFNRQKWNEVYDMTRQLLEESGNIVGGNLQM